MLGRAAAAGVALLAVSWLGLWGSFGLPALAIESPRAGARIGVDGVDLLVRFVAPERVEPATVRVLLNGADVTARCTTGHNGVTGRLHGLLDGRNHVRVEAFVRAPAGWLVEQAREVEVRFRPPLGFDRG